MNDETLISYLLGDLSSPDDVSDLQKQLSENPEFEQRLENLRRSLNAIRMLPRDDVKDSVVVALLKQAKAEVTESSAPIIKLPTFASRLAAAAAAVAIVGLIGFGAMFMPEPNESLIATTNGQAVHNSDVIESGIGETRRIELSGGGMVLLDGASAVQIFEQGEFSPPRIEVLHGRAIVSAEGSAPVIVTAWQRRIDVMSGAKAAISFDTPFAHISDEQFEVRSQTIEEVVGHANKLGISIDASSLNNDVLQRRVSFYGRAVNKEAFASTLLRSMAKYGVQFQQHGTQIKLTCETAYTTDGQFASTLEIAALEGEVIVQGSDESKSISSTSENYFSVYGNGDVIDTIYEQRSERGFRDLVVWAGLGQDSEARDTRLPAGSVIHPDSLVVFDDGSERIFKLGGPEYVFPLAGGQKGRIIGLMSSGAEFEYKQGKEVKRVFIPFSKLK